MKYYLVGIKGSGMSALANILLQDGHTVEGVDVDEDFYTCKHLNGIRIVSFNKFILKDDFFYIIGNAYINHPVTLKVTETKLPYEIYPKFINRYFRNLNMIAISGSHGKTRL